MATEEFHRKLTAILSADVVGYSRLMGDDETATVKILENYKGAMSSLIKQHRGRVVDSPGDNLLAEFGSVVDAVQCAVSIQKELQTRNADLPKNRRMEFRIGINLGDVIEEDARIYGDGVNIAARLEALADPGGICVSKTAFDHIESKLPLGYEFLGEQTVKNIAKPVGAYKVLMETRVVDSKTKREAEAVSFWRRKSVLSFGIIVILVIVAVLYWKFYLRGPSIEQASPEPEQVTATVDVKEAPKTIAVLPFDDLSPEKDQEYFVDGLSEEILNSLCQIPDLGVAGKTSSFSFKGKDKTIQEIASVLGVDHLLEGSVRKAGNSLRITAQLVRASDGLHLWSETYDRELKDIFDIQEDIANSVADKLKLTLEAFNLVGGTENIKAYELYLVAQGQDYSFDNMNGISRALKSIDAAIALDPEFALAWALKGQAHNILSIFGPTKGSATEQDEATRAAMKSIEIEPDLASGYYALGDAKMSLCDWNSTELAYRKAIDLMPGPVSKYENGIPMYYILVGKFKKSYEISKERKRNDPMNKNVLSTYLFTLAFSGDMNGAEEEYKRCKALFGEEWSSGDGTISFLRLGSGNIVSSDDIVTSYPMWVTLKEFLGSSDEGLRVLRQLVKDDQNLSSSDLQDISLYSAYFGDPEFALDILEKSVKIQGSSLFCIWLPAFKEVRQLSRFKKYLREIGLVDYWNEFGWPDICHKLDNGDFVCD